MMYYAAPLASFWFSASEYRRLSSVESTWEVKSEILPQQNSRSPLLRNALAPNHLSALSISRSHGFDGTVVLSVQEFDIWRRGIGSARTGFRRRGSIHL